MKIRYTGTTDPLLLTHGKIYEVLSIERRYYRILDDTNDDYLYPPRLFEIVDDSGKAELEEKGRQRVHRNAEKFKREHPEEYRELVERRRNAHPERK